MGIFFYSDFSGHLKALNSDDSPPPGESALDQRAHCVNGVPDAHGPVSRTLNYM